MARALRAALVALVAAAALGGCGRAGAGDTLTFQVFGDPEELAVYRKLASAYQERSDERMQVIEVPDRDSHLQKLSTGFAGGRPPDVFLVNYRNFASFAARGALDPVGPRLGASQALDRAAFYPQPLEAFTYDGVLQCLPQNVSSLVVYYNRDLFHEAGVPLPRRDWTYRDLLDAARRLTEPPRDDGGVRRYGIGVDPSIVRLAPFVWSAGADIVDDARDPGRFTLDTRGGREGIAALLALRGAFDVAPSEREVDGKPLEDRFLDGELGMLMSSRREVPTLRTVRDFTWDVAPFPRLVEPASVLHSDAYCVSAGEGADRAWRFVEFAAGPEGQRILARGGRTVPSLRAVAESADFLDAGRPPASSRVFLDAIPTMRRLPVASTWPEIEDAVDLAIKRAFYDEMTVDEALERIDRETAPLLERARDARP